MCGASFSRHAVLLLVVVIMLPHILPKWFVFFLVETVAFFSGEPMNGFLEMYIVAVLPYTEAESIGSYLLDIRHNQFSAGMPPSQLLKGSTRR